MEVSAKSSYNIQEAFLDLTRNIYLKIQKKEIDPYDKEAGARFSEAYLQALQDPGMKSKMDLFEGKKTNQSSCCN